MDESGTHAGSPIVTVAAYIARPRTWEAFTRRWNARKKPVKIYHAVDCANSRGEFKGWIPAQRNAFCARLLPTIAEFELRGIAVGIDIRAYDKALTAYPDIKKLMGNPYTSCFQWALQEVVNNMQEHANSERIEVIHEQNSFRGEVEHAFKFVDQSRKNRRGAMTLSFGTKEQHVPLQTADVLAYEANKRLRDLTAPERRALTALGPFSARIQYFNKENMPWMIDRLRLLMEEQKVFGKPITFLRD
jgi:Protein of unknown function (DUF3800)